jgi:hypothetical protein
MTIVPPTLEPTGRIRYPKKVTETDGVVHALQSNSWSGAVIPNPPTGRTFSMVTGSWIVPNAYPPQSAKQGNGWKDGLYESSAWVGIDGWGTPSVLQTGTVSKCQVSGGKIVSQDAYAWLEWFPAGEVRFTQLAVKPGDVMNAVVCGGAATAVGYVGLQNISSGVVTGLTDINTPKGTVLSNKTVEWVLEDDTIGSSLGLFPDYGATFFFGAICTSTAPDGSLQEQDLNSATVIDMTTSGSSSGTEESTGLVLKNEVLMCYAFNHAPNP